MKTKPNSMVPSTTNHCDDEGKDFSDFNVVIELDDSLLMNVAGGTGKAWSKV